MLLREKSWKKVETGAHWESSLRENNLVQVGMLAREDEDPR